MGSMRTKSNDDLILHRALDSRLLDAIEFATILAELSQTDVAADEYLVSKGYIDEQQRMLLLRSLQNEQADEDATLAYAEQQRPTINSSPETTAFLGPELPEEPEITQHHDTRYEWVENFAEGGLGAVWRATDTTIGRNVALK